MIQWEPTEDQKNIKLLISPGTMYTMDTVSEHSFEEKDHP